MDITTKTLLNTTVYGTPSGNYDGSSQDFEGDPCVAANYYAGQGSIQTARIDVGNFVGVITLQATLNDTVESALWFDVYTFGDGSTADSLVTTSTVIGNFSYMRVHVTDFSDGTINSITLAF